MKHRLNGLGIACLIATAVAFSGCQQTIDARWTTAADTEEHWEALSTTLPVELYGGLANVSNGDIARAIPHAVAANQLLDDEVATRDARAPHYIVAIGGNDPPRDSSYCARHRPDFFVDDSTHPSEIILSLCDGQRLVAWSRTRIGSATTSAAEVAHAVKRLENLTLIGIAYSPSQYTPIEVGSSYPQGQPPP